MGKGEIKVIDSNWAGKISYIFIFGIGQAIGPAVAGRLKDFSGTFVDAFVLAAAVLLLGAGGTIAMKKIS